MFHCKDIGPGPGYAMLDVGDGTLDWPRIAKAARTHGVRHLFVEHDNPADPLASVRRSHAALARATR
jgi:sugar phosphate isomerase/epimerase